MSKVKEGDTVKVHYTGKFEDGTEFDSTRDRDPISFTIGEGKMIEGFEHAVKDMEVGKEETISIPSKEAYGPYRDELVIEIKPDQLPEDLNPVVGDRLRVKRKDGGTADVTVTDVTPEKVSLDANHPLAGKTLVFDMEVVDVS